MSDWGLSTMMFQVLDSILKLETEVTRDDRLAGASRPYPSAFVLRGLVEDRDVLRRHRVIETERKPDVWYCEECDDHLRVPYCAEVLSVARRHGIMTS